MRPNPYVVFQEWSWTDSGSDKLIPAPLKIGYTTPWFLDQLIQTFKLYIVFDLVRFPFMTNSRLENVATCSSTIYG